jgi:hypothetical protein
MRTISRESREWRIKVCRRHVQIKESKTREIRQGKAESSQRAVHRNTLSSIKREVTQ